MKQLDSDMSKTKKYVEAILPKEYDLHEDTTIDSYDYFGQGCDADGDTLVCGAYGRNQVFVCPLACGILH